MTSMQIARCGLREQIEKIAQDSYIQKCIGKADIPDYFIEMIEILFAHLSHDGSEKKRLGIAATLLQMGLEMHKRVSDQEVVEAKEIKQRQQYVLAGDYYSSLFYYFLAQEQAFEMIQYFSQQILSINKAKLSLHLQSLQQSTYDQEMLTYLKKVTSGLLMAIADFFHVQDEFIFLWKKTGSFHLLMIELAESREWMKFPPDLRLQLFQEWNHLIDCINDQLQEEPKQQLLTILKQHEDLLEEIAVKES